MLVQQQSTVSDEWKSPQISGRNHVHNRWVSVAEFAAAAGLTRQSAYAAVKRAHDRGLPWRGAAIFARVTKGCGGNAGHRYELQVETLPEPIQARLRGDLEPPKGEHLSPKPSSPLPIPLDRQQSRRQAKAAAVAMVERHPEGTPERRSAMKEACQRFGLSQRTLYRLMSSHRERGIGAFQHAAKGREKGPQVAVTRAFDRAFLNAGGSEAELARLRSFIDERLRAEWANKPGRAGWRCVGREVSTSLEIMLPQLTGRRLSIPRKLFTLTRARADNEQLRDLRQVDIQRHDAKRFHDTAPRISRDYSPLGIMDQVVCDVKNMDMKVQRADGTEGWPRLIGFMDMGTQRIFYRLVLNPEREGIRQEHIIEAFLAMGAHPEWGFPRSLHRDNGSEFAAFDRIQFALRQIAFPGKAPIVSAIPYNSSAKPIEGFFSRMDRYVSSQIDGWTGGDRMKSKTKNIGKAPEPYPHSFEAFCAEVDLRMQDLMNTPVHGEGNRWGGKTPNELFAEKQAATGWRPITASQLDIDMAFCKRETRQISQGCIRYGGTRWRHPDLPTRGPCQVIIPWRRGANPIFVIPGLGPAYLDPDYPFHPLDQEGAKEAGRRKAADRRRVRNMAASIGPSHADENLRWRNSAAATALPAPSVPDVDAGSAISQLSEFKQQADERKKAEKSERVAEVERRRKLTTKLGKIRA